MATKTPEKRVRPKLRIKKGDRVEVLTGRDRGKRGDVLKVMPMESRVIVQGVNIVKRHTRPSQAGSGGIVEKEAPIHVSNVAHIDPASDRPTRVGYKTLEDGRKVRVAKRSGEIIDR
ncbi:MAG: 50S ribosomal protein L24 [Alphaproteobacteria bacterium]|jgi:large subunit ribosomal protein L24|nr:50S ribosomal protein L24 [Alphaproteobacteria bacterium]